MRKNYHKQPLLTGGTRFKMAKPCVYCVPVQTKLPVYTDVKTQGALPTTTMSPVGPTTNLSFTTTARPIPRTYRINIVKSTIAPAYRSTSFRTYHIPGNRSPATPVNGDHKAVIIATSLAVTGLLLLLFVAVLVFMRKRRKSRPSENASNLEMEAPTQTKTCEVYDDVVVSNKATESENPYEYAYEKIAMPAAYSPLGRKDAQNVYEAIQYVQPTEQNDNSSEDVRYVNQMPGVKHEEQDATQRHELDNKRHSQFPTTPQGSYLAPVVLQSKSMENPYGAAYVKVLP